MALTQLDLSPDVEECMDNCFEASQAAERCSDECITMGDPDMARCIQLCRDVADLTAIHARMMARGSDWSDDLAGVCAEACTRCAEECQKYEGKTMETCAEACRQAARTCSQMAS